MLASFVFAAVDLVEETFISSERYADDTDRIGVKRKFRGFAGYIVFVFFTPQVMSFMPDWEEWVTIKEVVSGFVLGNLVGLFLCFLRDRNPEIKLANLDGLGKLMFFGLMGLLFILPGIVLSGRLGFSSTAGAVTAYAIILPMFYDPWRRARFDEIVDVRIKREVERHVEKLTSCCFCTEV